MGTRLDLLVPSGSTPFMQARVLGKGGTLQKLLEQLLAERAGGAAAAQGAAREEVRAAKVGQPGQQGQG